MSFNFLQLKTFRILLFPFACLYGLAVTTRNFLFDKNILKHTLFNLPIINVGNLSVGGTGKSPMVEYLILLLKDYKVATLSRGYKRKTKGYLLAGETTTVSEIGDEPYEFFRKFPDIAVAVGEKRVTAVSKLLNNKPETGAIILDDAFQHRYIKAGINLLLTEYSNLFTRDLFLPAGSLRDGKASYKRAEIIVVTKCPAALSEVESQKIKSEIKLLPNQSVFFSTLMYRRPYHITGHEERSITYDDYILLVCGIANPKPLQHYISKEAKSYEQKFYADHHIFTKADLKDIIQSFEGIKSRQKIIITTEKDATRLIRFKDELSALPFFVIPVKHHFLYNQETVFNKLITDFVKCYRDNNN